MISSIALVSAVNQTVSGTAGGDTTQRFKALSLMESCVSLLALLLPLHRVLLTRKIVVRLQLWRCSHRPLEEESFVRYWGIS
jgi:hypothetical protein